MFKKITLGSNNGFLVDYKTKQKVVDWLYSKIDLSKYRYIILNQVQKLKFLQDNPHYVSPNFKGYNYLVLFLTINGKKMCVAIDRKKLSYHKEQLDMKTLQIIQINVKTSDSIFKGTVFDGKLIQTNNEYIFLIQDCFYLMDSMINDMEMDKKMNHLDSILKVHFKKETEKYCKNFEFKLNKLCSYDDLEQLIKNLSTLSIGTNGIIFFPKVSGVTVLHIEKKVEKVDIKNNTGINIEMKTIDIINNFVNCLKSRTYSYETNGKLKVYWLSRTNVPDVYNICEKENGDKQGIAHIPNLKISHLCDDMIKDKPVKFNCIYCNKFKKWIPLNVIN